MENGGEIKNGNYLSRHLATVILAIVAGTGGGLTLNLMHDPAPDRFTGTQGKEMIAEQDHINRRLIHMEDAHHQHQKDVAEIKIREVEMSGMLRECQGNMKSGISQEHDKITELQANVGLLEQALDHLEDDYEDTENQYKLLYNKVMTYKREHPEVLQSLGIEQIGIKK